MTVFLAKSVQKECCHFYHQQKRSRCVFGIKYKKVGVFLLVVKWYYDQRQIRQTLDGTNARKTNTQNAKPQKRPTLGATNARILNFATHNRILKLRQTLEATYTRIQTFEILIDVRYILYKVGYLINRSILYIIDTGIGH